MRAISMASFPPPARAAALALALVAATLGAQAPVGPDFSQLAATRLIVKFRDGTSLAKATTRAASDPASDRELAAELERLTRDLPVVLRAKQATSGGELVLELDREALGRTIASALAKRPEISAATPVEAPKRIRPASTLSVRIEPAPGADAAALQGAIDAVSRELGSTLLFRPAGSTSSGSPEAEISIGHLMMRVQMHLRERPEVEYSQLDQIAQPFGAS